MYIVLCCISIVLAVVSVILLIIGFKKEDKYQGSAGVAIALLSVCVALNIDIPSPTIFPLNNDTEVYDNDLTITITSVPFTKIYYSVDGSDPKGENIYSEPIQINSTTTISTRGRFFWCWSEVNKSAFTFLNTQPSTIDNNMVEKESEEEQESDISESSITSETIDETNLPKEDYLVKWEDPLFKKIFTEYFGKDDIYYSDLKDIHSIIIYGDKFAYINDPDGDKNVSSHSLKFGIYNDRNDYRYIYKEDGKEAIVYNYGEYISLNDLVNFSSLYDLKISSFKKIDCSIFQREKFDKLNHLSLDSCNITDEQFRVLCSQTQLKLLSAERGWISNIDNVANLKELHTLNIYRNDVCELTPLSTLTNLYHLQLGCNNISDVSALSNLKNLEFVGLRECPINDYSPINFVERIEK